MPEQALDDILFRLMSPWAERVSIPNAVALHLANNTLIIYT